MLMTQSSSNAAVSSGMATDTQSSDSRANALILEVIHGRTRFRERPVSGPRFLIGSGPACDLRLGGEGMPPLHSIIVVGDREICLEAVSRVPGLFVNGRRCESAILGEGDVIRLGAVEMIARMAAPRPAPLAQTAPVNLQRPISLQDRDLQDIANLQDEDPAGQDIARLSASELIDLIENEEQAVEAFERKQHLGAAALLQAALNQKSATSSPAILHAGTAHEHKPHISLAASPGNAGHRRLRIDPPASREGATARGDEELLSDLTEIGRVLNDFSRELQERALRSSARETGYAAAATMLLETQQKLVSQVELLVTQVEALRASQPVTEFRPRAIA